MIRAVPDSSSLVSEHPAVSAHLGAPAAPQRARILDAVTRVVAERGYVDATVADIVRAAGVSRSTFYELFDGKEACFLEAHRHGVEVMQERVREAVHEVAKDDWRAQLRAGIRAYLDVLDGEGVFARTYLIEIHAAGPRALQSRADAMQAFADRYAATAALAGRAPGPDALTILCAGTEQLVTERVRTGRVDELRELEDVFCACAESVILGAPEAGA
jgi:AcrR family transcriptional regulator